MVCVPDNYVRIALTEEEFARLLEILSDREPEPVVLKLQAKALSHQAKRMRAAEPPTKRVAKTTR